MQANSPVAGPASRVSTVAGLIALVTLALVVRLLGSTLVLIDGGEVVLQLGDPYYHLRRASFSLVHLPEWFSFDPALAFPSGGPVPWPPLFDLGLAALARALGGGVGTLERVAALQAPVLGALTVVPVFLTARRLFGDRAALLASALLALLPAHSEASAVGNGDHTAAVTLLGTVLMALYVAALDERTRGRRLILLFVSLALVRAAILLTWQGSILYLGFGEPALILAGASRRSPRLLAANALSALGAAALVAPIAWDWPRAVGGPFSASELSRLHVLLLGLASLVSATLVGLSRWSPAASARSGLVRAGGVGAFVGAIALLFPDVRAGVMPTASFLGRGESLGAFTLEQSTAFGAFGVALAELGWWVLLIPVGPLAFVPLLRHRDLTAAAAYLIACATALGALTLVQLRFGTDYSPVASIAFAPLLERAIGFYWFRILGASGPIPAGRATMIAALLLGLSLWPAMRQVHLRKLSVDMRFGWSGADTGDRALRTADGTLLRFAETLRDELGQPEDRLVRDLEPRTGVMAWPAMAHTIRWIAQVGLPADAFGSYVGPGTYEAVSQFFTIRNEDDAVAMMRRLRTPWLVTQLLPGADGATVVRRLHEDLGQASGALEHLGRFRLVAEDPVAGVPFAALLGQRARATLPPYRLFEVVDGANLQMTTDPGAAVSVRVVLVSPGGRRISYGVETIADAQGHASLRIPYATKTSSSVRPDGPLVVDSGSYREVVELTEEDVRSGREVSVRFGPNQPGRSETERAGGRAHIP